MALADWLYGTLPRSWQDRIYNDHVSDAINRINNLEPVKDTWFTRSEWHADAVATARQLLEADEIEQAREMYELADDEWDRETNGAFDMPDPTEHQWQPSAEFSAFSALAHGGPMQWNEGDADLDRLKHDESPVVEQWSGDHGAELERLERTEDGGERSTDEPPERGIEDDEENER
jgi:hypothetical protein